MPELSSVESFLIPHRSTAEDRRIRLLIICSHPVQYASPVFRRLSEHPKLSALVAYCSLRGANATYDPEFEAIVQWDIPLLEGYQWVELRNLGTGSDSFFGLCNLDIWKLIRRGDFDAVICYTGYLKASFWLSFFAARASRSTFLFGTDVNTLVPRDGQSWKVAVKRLLWPKLYSLGDQVLVPSSASQLLLRSLGIQESHITLTPYVVDNDWWKTQAARVDRESIRKSWNVGPNLLVVLFCAKLQPWKRPGDLLHAFARAAVPNAVLVFAGEGPLRLQLESEALTLGLANRVRFLGFVNQSKLPEVYSASDLLVLPSEYEPFAVVVNEASCCGCPVIVTDRVGAAKDLVEPVNSSFVYPCGDVAVLSELLRSALGDPASLANYGRLARERMDTWSIQENVAAIVEAVRRAIGRKSENR
jgi:glycosyltransferase involved in cell wall biosynthesis